MDVYEIRRTNLLRLLEGQKKAKFAEDVHTSPSYISQLIADHAPRKMGDEVARKIESAKGLPRGWMDSTHSEQPMEWGVVANARRLPVISWTKAGEWSEAVDLHEPGCAEEWEMTDKGGPRSFVLIVEGDSMLAPHASRHSYPPGARIVVDPDAVPNPPCRVVAKLAESGEATFKELVRDAGQLFLRPLNPQYRTIAVSEGVEIIGVVITKIEHE